MGFFDVVNVYGLLFSLLMAAPHVIYIKTKSYDKTLLDNRAMLYIARLGRFSGFFLMSFNIGVLEKGFTEPKELMQMFWLVTTASLTALCLAAWAWFFASSKKLPAYLIVFLSSAAVIFSGICQVKTLLFTAGIIYLVGELYLTKRFFSTK